MRLFNLVCIVSAAPLFGACAHKQPSPEVVAKQEMLDPAKINVNPRVRTRPVFFDMYFEKGGVELSPRTKAISEAIAIELKKWFRDTVELKGHTCDLESAEYNLELGLRRAKAVANYIEEFGVEKERIVYSSVGEKHPLQPNDSEEHRAFNRRVTNEFVVGEYTREDMGVVNSRPGP